MPENYSTVSDEEILNVLRRAQEQALGTSDIASSLPITGAQTRNRLNNLVEDDRVKSSKIGGNHSWELADDEYDRPVHPELGRAVRWRSRFLHLSRFAFQLGVVLFGLGGALVLASITAMVQNTSVTLVTNQELLAYGYVFLAFGGALLTGAGGTRLGSIGIVPVAHWYHSLQQPDEESVQDQV